jgi:hypothetical protein
VVDCHHGGLRDFRLPATVVSTARDLFARSAVRRWLARAVGAVPVALGLRLAIE